MLFNGRVCLYWYMLALFPTWPSIRLASSWHLFTVSVQQYFLYCLQAVFGPNPMLLTAALSLLTSPALSSPARSASPISYLLLCQGSLWPIAPKLTDCTGPMTWTLHCWTTLHQHRWHTLTIPALVCWTCLSPYRELATSCRVPGPSLSIAFLTLFRQTHWDLFCFPPQQHHSCPLNYGLFLWHLCNVPSLILLLGVGSPWPFSHFLLCHLWQPLAQTPIISPPSSALSGTVSAASSLSHKCQNPVWPSAPSSLSSFPDFMINSHSFSSAVQGWWEPVDWSSPRTGIGSAHLYHTL